MQAALTATERGHKVTLFEKTAIWAVALYYVSIPDFNVSAKPTCLQAAP